MARKVAPLDVWLYGKRIAQVSQPRSGRIHFRLDFTEEALDTFGEGSNILSLSLPVSRRPVQDATGDLRVTNFLNGLLPEGALRQQVAAMRRVSTTDLMALLGTVGGDCAGAVQFLPQNSSPRTPFVRELSAAETARMIADLPTYNLPEGALPQASLAGLQDKILLTDLGDGRWGLPEQGAPSTHIIKPEPLAGVIPDLIFAEDWALRVASGAGLPAAESRIQEFDGRNALIVKRYDRTPDGQRIHQEDLCQALGLAPEDKYERLSEARSLGSRLSRFVARAAQHTADTSGLRASLLKGVTFNIVSGNGDAHSKNYSVLIGERGEVSMAPLYDTATVMFMNETFRGTGHVIAGKTRIDEVDASDIVSEAQAWGMARSIAERTVSETMESVRESISATPEPERLRYMRDNLDAFWVRKSWGSTRSVPSSSAEDHGSEQTSSGEVFVKGHTRNGKWVNDHWRQRPRR